jgi:hypothetical protein
MKIEKRKHKLNTFTGLNEAKSSGFILATFIQASAKSSLLYQKKPTRSGTAAEPRIAKKLISIML